MYETARLHQEKTRGTAVLRLRLQPISKQPIANFHHSGSAQKHTIRPLTPPCLDQGPIGNNSQWYLGWPHYKTTACARFAASCQLQTPTCRGSSRISPLPRRRHCDRATQAPNPTSPPSHFQHPSNITKPEPWPLRLLSTTLSLSIVRASFPTPPYFSPPCLASNSAISGHIRREH